MPNRTEDAIAELKTAYEADKTRSKIGKLREIYDVVRELKRGGMNSIKIVEILNEKHFASGKDGKGLTPRMFDVYMHRISKEREEQTLADRQKAAAPILHNRRSTDKEQSIEATTVKPDGSKEAEQKQKTIATIEEIKRGLHSTNIDPADFD